MCHSSLLFPSRKAGDDPYYLPVHISPYSNSGVHISYTILTLVVHISYNTNQKLANIFETLPTGVGNMDPKEVGNMVSSKKLCVRVGFHRGKAREKSQRRSKSTGQWKKTGPCQIKANAFFFLLQIQHGSVDNVPRQAWTKWVLQDSDQEKYAQTYFQTLCLCVLFIF